MSRCFPFPPPGYASLHSSGAALIESSIEKKKKKKKRQRRERKKEKIESEKRKISGISEVGKQFERSEEQQYEPVSDGSKKRKASSYSSSDDFLGDRRIQKQCVVTSSDKEECCYSEDLAQEFDCLDNIVNPKSMLKLASLYRNLIEEWVSQSLDNQEDWFFGSERVGGCSEEVVGQCSSGSTPWPRAHYLPEADIYATPYAIPY